MTIKTHGRMMTSDTIGITQLDLQDGTANQAIVTDGQGVLRFATVGAGGSVGSSVYVEDIRTGDGSTVTFTLSTAAPYEESILVFVDGVAQPTSSFTLPSTTSLTFSPAPGNGAAIRICHLGIASSIANNSITGAHLAMGGDTTGDVLFYNGTDYQRLTIGTAGQHLATNSATNAPEWVTLTQYSIGTITEILLLKEPTGSAVTTPRSGTWTNTSNVKQLEVTAAGAGGLGGVNNGATAGAAGTVGNAVKRIIDVSNITSLDWQIGLNCREPGGGGHSRPQATGSFFGSNGTLQTTGLTVTVVSGAITAIAFSGGGSGMTVAPIIVIESNADQILGRDGTGATATATISGGAVTGITVTNGGTGYVTGEVQAFFGIFGAPGKSTDSAAPPASFGTHRNHGTFNDSPARPGEGGSGEPGGGGARSESGHGQIYYKEYR